MPRKQWYECVLTTTIMLTTVSGIIQGEIMILILNQGACEVCERLKSRWLSWNALFLDVFSIEVVNKLRKKWFGRLSLVSLSSLESDHMCLLTIHYFWQTYFIEVSSTIRKLTPARFVHLFSSWQAMCWRKLIATSKRSDCQKQMTSNKIATPSKELRSIYVIVPIRVINNLSQKTVKVSKMN